MRLPIDTRAVAFICASDAQPVVDYESRRPKTDDNGVALHQVAVVAMSDGTAEVINVKVAGQPSGVTAGSPVVLVELVAVPWAMGERSGVAYRATRIDPAGRPAAPSRDKGASAS